MSAISSLKDQGHDDRYADLITRRKRFLGPAYRHFYRDPVHLVRGSGVHVWDANGKQYLDFYNNVPSVGHCHPQVVEAMSRQASVLNTHTRYLHDSVVDYAEALLATFPAPLEQVMFTCTGSEANDLALRIARSVTGATGVIVVGKAYHGVTGDLAEISPSLGPASAPAAHVRMVPSPTGVIIDGTALADRFEADVRTAIKSLQDAGHGLAMFIFDTVFASQGLFVEPAGFIAGAVEAVREHGGLWVADEVQSGLARPGQSMWAFERHGVVPDIVTLGKPIGNGHPLAAMVTRADLIAEFGKKTRYFNTFGGNPVSTEVGKAVLQVIRDENLMHNAAATGTVLLDGLRELTSRHHGISAIRGAGLYAAIEFVKDDGTPDSARQERIVEAMRERGVLIGACGEDNNCLKIRPLLPTGKNHVEVFLDKLDDALRTH